jgi:hypothetical protein
MGFCAIEALRSASAFTLSTNDFSDGSVAQAEAVAMRIYVIATSDATATRSRLQDSSQFALGIFEFGNQATLLRIGSDRDHSVKTGIKLGLLLPAGIVRATDGIAQSALTRRSKVVTAETRQ